MAASRATSVRQPATPRPTTSASSPSRPAPPASRRARCTSTATCWRSATASRATCCAPTADDVFIGSPPLAFTFGLGGLLLFPMRVGASAVLLEKAPPDAAAAGDRRIPRDRRASPRRPPTARCSAMLGEHDISQPAQVRVGRRGAAAGDVRGCGARRPASRSSTASARPRCCTSSSARRERRHPRPARPASAVPGYEARVVDDDGTTVPPGTSAGSRCAGPTGCRYLADRAPARLRAGRLEPHRRRLRDGRGRLLLVPGAHRRHDHLGRLQHRRPRGRGRAARASRGGRVRRGRRRPTRSAARS